MSCRAVNDNHDLSVEFRISEPHTKMRHKWWTHATCDARRQIERENQRRRQRNRPMHALHRIVVSRLHNQHVSAHADAHTITCTCWARSHVPIRAVVRRELFVARALRHLNFILEPRGRALQCEWKRVSRMRLAAAAAAAAAV